MLVAIKIAPDKSRTEQISIVQHSTLLIIPKDTLKQFISVA